jgi:hypothetical protein
LSGKRHSAELAHESIEPAIGERKVHRICLLQRDWSTRSDAHGMGEHRLIQLDRITGKYQWHHLLLIQLRNRSREDSIAIERLHDVRLRNVHFMPSKSDQSDPSVPFFLIDTTCISGPESLG